MNSQLDDIQKFTIRQQISGYAKSIGFDLIGFSPTKIEEKYLQAFEDWLEAGHQGSMDYMKKIEQRRDINLLLPGAKTVIVFGLNYYHEQPPLPRGHGRIARYAYGRDYHKVIGKKLKKMEEFICEIYTKIQPALTPSSNAQAEISLNQISKFSRPSSSTLPKICAHAQILPQKTAKKSHSGFGSESAGSAHPSPATTKSYVDTGPILERAYAEQAGLGRIGKNGCIITEKFGSWIFLSEVITTIDLNFSTKLQNSDDAIPTSPANLQKVSPVTLSCPAAMSSSLSTHIQSVDDFLGSPANLKSCNLREVTELQNRQATLSSSTSKSSSPNNQSIKVSPGTHPKSASLPVGRHGSYVAGAHTDFLLQKTAAESRLTSGSAAETFLQSLPPPSRWSSPAEKSFNICGNCTRCITSCPTGAIIAPGVIDSRLCISYLTIENRKKIPPKLAKIIRKTKRLFGCDICQEVCPHNIARSAIASLRASQKSRVSGTTLSQARARRVLPSCPSAARTKHDYQSNSFAKQNTVSKDILQLKSPPGVRQKMECTQVNPAQHTDLDGLLTPIAGDSLDIRKLLKKSSISPNITSSKSSDHLTSTSKTTTTRSTPSPLSSDASFLRTFAGSPLMRAKRRGLARTARIF